MEESQAARVCIYADVLIHRQLPVVARDDPRRVIGLLEHRHVITAYRRALPG